MIKFTKTKKYTCKGTYSKFLDYDTISYLEEGKWEFNQEEPTLILIKNNDVGDSSSHEIHLIIKKLTNDSLALSIEGGIIKFYSKDTVGFPPKPNPVPSELIHSKIF